MNLAARSTAAERMDTDCADYDDYARCLADLARVNRVTLTHRPLLAWLARETAALRSFSLLDVACGHGDLLRRVRRWSMRRGIDATLHGIDLNPWSLRAARAATPQEFAITWHHGDVFAFQPAQRYDFIVSSQFTHHLTDADIVRFIALDGAACRARLVHRRPVSPLVPILRLRTAGLGGRLAPFRPLRRPRLHRAQLRSGGLAPPDRRPPGFDADAVRISRETPFRLCVSRRCAPR